MDDSRFQIFMEDLIKNTDFTFVSPGARERVYAEIMAVLFQDGKELSDDDLSMAAGGLREFPGSGERHG